MSEQGAEDGYTYSTTGRYTFFSCYSSGNRELCYLENMLDAISSRILRNVGKYIVAGDFNAKFEQWDLNKKRT